ncbi:hypothetical protein [Aeromicrobium sp. UC242_57]|uniref:hypothetical protein n=1 Tax=Aeromicrobium sp. UC242_57 TaxID=3374624 RepID=UPI00378EB3AE
MTITAAAMALLLGACGASDDPAPAGDPSPAIVVENCGREVTIDTPIERAVAINQPAVERCSASAWTSASPESA